MRIVSRQADTQITGLGRERSLLGAGRTSVITLHLYSHLLLIPPWDSFFLLFLKASIPFCFCFTAREPSLSVFGLFPHLVPLCVLLCAVFVRRFQNLWYFLTFFVSLCPLQHFSSSLFFFFFLSFEPLPYLVKWKGFTLSLTISLSLFLSLAVLPALFIKLTVLFSEFCCLE